MSIFEIFDGIQGSFITSLLLLPSLIVSWVLSRQLHEKRKRKSYIFLSKLTLGYLAFNGISLLFSLIMTSIGIETFAIASFLNIIVKSMFIVFLYGLYRIHNKENIKLQLIHIVPTIVVILTGLFVPAVGYIIATLSILSLNILYGKKLGRGTLIYIASGLFVVSLLISTVKSIVPSLHGSFQMLNTLLEMSSYTLLLVYLVEHSLIIMQSSYVSAITDSLTGLFNRRYFTKYINGCVDRRIPVNVIFCDIDNFKKLNDTKGHKVGDEVLRQVATIFKEEVQGIGVAGRYGGEEMVLLVQSIDVEMEKLTERMRSRIEKETIATASIGYRLYEPGVPAELLIKQADEAMYEAKAAGRNRVISYKERVTNIW
ncbi:GGDEF domain-containing protein [Paenibacillus illinoisensis]|uniref:GGDEF domain-containing protein n=1 Tax=Paenibacillus illinoisensis TaxID=59845 RepID=UPI001C8E3571|nr:GGDEF domain-containing protein [Paenibacillus illinoisensis]MBY0217912.1 GGDEF domain-containing protein [Paenibacillus illinoisensis]